MDPNRHSTAFFQTMHSNIKIGLELKERIRTTQWLKPVMPCDAQKQLNWDCKSPAPTPTPTPRSTSAAARSSAPVGPSWWWCKKWLKENIATNILAGKSRIVVVSCCLHTFALWLIANSHTMFHYKSWETQGRSWFLAFQGRSIDVLDTLP